MFHVYEISRTFNHRGAVVRTDERRLASFEQAVDATAYRFKLEPRGCHMMSITDKRSISLTTRDDAGAEVSFADVFRMTEGQEAYDAVLSGKAPPVDEVSWIAGKLAA